MSLKYQCLKGDENLTCTHCWHSSNEQHAVNVLNGYHLDQYCCFCGINQCTNINYGENSEKHGIFLKG